MSDQDSDYTWVWVILGISFLAGIAFFFNKEMWPQLHQPVLRCLVAPIAGIVLVGGWYLLYIVLPQVAVQLLWKIFLWLTVPSLVFPISLLIALATGLALLFKWAVAPLAPFWAMIDSIAIGLAAGFLIIRLVRVFQSDSWALQTVIASPISIGLTYWIAIKLRPALGIGLIITTIAILLTFLSRFLYEEHKRAQEVVNSYQPVSASSLPQAMKEQILKQIRDRMGAAQYNNLVSAIGEDGIINQVLANMRKS